MSAASVNGAASAEAKSAKKRKAKVPAAAPTTNGSSTPVVESNEPSANGVDNESPILKELQKSLRNANKKITATAKAQSIVDENPGVSLNDLVASKKINTDQKAQMERKPAILQQIKSLEEQLERYRQFGKDYEERFEQEKESIKQAYEAQIAKAKQQADDDADAKAQAQQEADLLVLTQFLHTASSKRNDESTPALEGKAFEGVLLKIYQGTTEAIDDMKKLVTGADDKVTSIEGDELDFTFAQVKNISVTSAPQVSDSFEEPEASKAEGTSAETSAETPAAATTSTLQTATDPTVANAGLTEINDTVTMPIRTDDGPQPATEDTPSGIPEQASIEAGSANAVAESSWDPSASAANSWIEVPRDPAETDTGLTATPADHAMHTNSWAEEANEGAAVQAKVAADNEGFETVQHHHPRERGRGRGRGEFRGRGRGGEFRGRGRGDRGERGDGERRGGGGRGRGPREGGQSRGGRGGRREGQAGPRPEATAPSTGN